MNDAEVKTALASMHVDSVQTEYLLSRLLDRSALQLLYEDETTRSID
jgi:hypothetical protein